MKATNTIEFNQFSFETNILSTTSSSTSPLHNIRRPCQNDTMHVSNER